MSACAAPDPSWAVTAVAAVPDGSAPTSAAVVPCGFPATTCEWSYAVLPRSPRYAVDDVSPNAYDAEISTYAEPDQRYVRLLSSVT